MSTKPFKPFKAVRVRAQKESAPAPHVEARQVDVQQTEPVTVLGDDGDEQQQVTEQLQAAEQLVDRLEDDGCLEDCLEEQLAAAASSEAVDEPLNETVESPSPSPAKQPKSTLLGRLGSSVYAFASSVSATVSDAAQPAIAGTVAAIAAKSVEINSDTARYRKLYDDAITARVAQYAGLAAGLPVSAVVTAGKWTVVATATTVMVTTTGTALVVTAVASAVGLLGSAAFAVALAACRTARDIVNLFLQHGVAAEEAPAAA